MLSDTERDALLIRMDERLKNLEGALARDYKCLYGNGQPGLLARVQTLEDMHKNENTTLRKYGSVIAWIVTTVIAVYSALKHH